MLVRFIVLQTSPSLRLAFYGNVPFPISHFEPRPLVIPSPTLPQRRNIPPSLFPTPAQNGNHPSVPFSHGFPSPSQNGNIPPSLFLMAFRPLLKTETSLAEYGNIPLFIAPPPPICLHMSGHPAACSSTVVYKCLNNSSVMVPQHTVSTVVL